MQIVRALSTLDAERALAEQIADRIMSRTEVNSPIYNHYVGALQFSKQARDVMVLAANLPPAQDRRYDMATEYELVEAAMSGFDEEPVSVSCGRPSASRPTPMAPPADPLPPLPLNEDSIDAGSLPSRSHATLRARTAKLHSESRIPASRSRASSRWASSSTTSRSASRSRIAARIRS